MPSTTRVLGFGDPVMDILAHVSHEYLGRVTQEPGGCFAVEPEEMERLLQGAAEQGALKRMPGGSAANVVKGLANLMGDGVTASFIGMVGKDTTGKEYRDGLAAQGVKPMLLESSSGAPSACAVCLVTPDGQRTMRTCLGASLELQSASQLHPDWCSGVQLLHCEGYCLYRPQLAMQVMQAAKAQGAIVSMDLASFELVRHCKSSLLQLLESRCLDLVLANHEEAAELAAVMDLAAPSASHDAKVQAAQDFLLQHIKVSVVSLGPRGCTARSAAGQSAAAPAANVKVEDTIGAGDFFTAGFLAAYLQGAPLQLCAEAGCAAGAEAVQVSGAELSPSTWSKLRSHITAIAAKGRGSASQKPASSITASPLAALVDWCKARQGLAVYYVGLPLCVISLGILGQVTRRLVTRG